MRQVHAERAHRPAEEREHEEKRGAQDATEPAGLERAERTCEPDDARVGRAFGGDDGER